MTHFFLQHQQPEDRQRKLVHGTFGTGYEHKTGCFLFTPLPLENIRDPPKLGQVESQKSGSSRLDG